MKRYLPLILTVVAALGAGITLVPGAWELASMKLRDKNFAAAEQAFEKKYRDGDRSREVLLPLAELYVRTGRVDDAIGVLTKYTQVHPGERDVVARLAALMTEAQQIPGAVAALELLAKNTPEPKALRELDRQYDIAQDTVGRIGALMRLAQSGAATPRETLTLTGLLAAKGRTGDALKVSYNAIRANPDKVQHELVQIFAALAHDHGRPDLIARTVLPWSKRQRAIAPLNAVASALIDKRDPKSALALVRGSAAFAMGATDAIILAARLEADHGSKVSAFDLLDGLRRSRKLPPSQDAAFVALALGQRRTDTALAHILSRGHAGFDDPSLLYAIGRAAAEQKLQWIKALDEALGETPRHLPAAQIALALGDASRAIELATKAESVGANVGLAQLYAELGDLQSAARVFDITVPDASAASTQDLAQATATAIALKRGRIAFALAERLVEQDKSTEAAIQRARAMTLIGRGSETLEFLSSLKSKSDLVERAEIEALFATKRMVELRAKLIAKLSAGAQPTHARTEVIFMLNDLKLALGPGAGGLAEGLSAELNDKTLTGAPREARLALLTKIAPLTALPYLKTAAEQDPDKQGYAYAKILKEMKRIGELKAFLLMAATAAKSAKIRDDFLYELLKQGGGREGLHLLAGRAQNDGEKWFFAYDEALAKYGSRMERLEALAAFAYRANIAHQTRLQIAFQMLNLGDKTRAEPLFLKLAESKGPQSPEVRQLAFLWGPRPGASARAWLKRRAQTALVQDRAAWASLLLNAGDTQSAEEVLTGVDTPETIAALAAVYAETRNAQALKALLRSGLNAANESTATALAIAADALSLSAEASRAYERAAKPALAGRAAFFAGDHARALTLLNASPADPQTSFYLAEVLTALKRVRDAAPHYRTALAQLGRNGEAKKMRLIALARLKEHDAAQHELSEPSGDPAEASEAREAYAGALLDQGDTARAGDLLGP